MKLPTQVFSDVYQQLVRNSKYRWLIVVGSIVYLVSPPNLWTDLFPIIGWIDDGLLITLLVTELTAALQEFRDRRSQPTATVSDEHKTTVDVDSTQVK
ncbi:DUF1232 domain-containing protein [Alkalinema sp. FACHB-956]|uniref:YkvA family protein n=1 Tax=Alkalinema sp. FACHB-956 TaxID=2692768 RepID=UPI001682CE6E|nr:DUF1232 domain-containing protein [Alkalinema sp. FACHB-956]MBD2326385.1 DUF1232 domain-containing protein [Alkalinema sp. FACHB-956]